MKTRVLLFISFLLLNFTSFSQTTLIDFPTTTTLDGSTGNLYAQMFTLPAGNDYYVTQIGVKVASTTGAGKVYFGLYNPSGYLLFKSKEFYYPGGVDSLLLVDVPLGVQDLLGGNLYSIACMYKGVGNFVLKTQTSAVNTGVATLETFSNYKTSVTYPHLPDPIAVTGNYGFNVGFVIRGNLKTSAIEPENEILEFNCGDNLEISNGAAYYSEITMPAGSDKALRQIGIKIDSTTITGAVSFGIYDNSLNLIYVTNNLSLDITKEDTCYVAIPAGAVTLAASQNYYIGIGWNGGGYLPIKIMKKPVSRGLATIGNYSRFNASFTYPNFPATYTWIGNYAFAYGIVMNGDVLIPTKTTDVSYTSAIRIFPTLADNTVGLYAEALDEEATVTVYSMLGEQISQCNWNTASSLALNVAGYAQGNYLVQVASPSTGIKTLKFIKK